MFYGDVPLERVSNNGVSKRDLLLAFGSGAQFLLAI